MRIFKAGWLALLGLPVLLLGGSSTATRPTLDNKQKPSVLRSGNQDFRSCESLMDGFEGPIAFDAGSTITFLGAIACDKPVVRVVRSLVLGPNLLRFYKPPLNG